VRPDKEIPISGRTDGDSLEALIKVNDTDSLTGLSDGVQAAYVFSPEIWIAKAETVLAALAATGEPFTVDDLRRAGIEDPDIPQRWGALFAVAQNRGTIVLVGLLLHRTTGGASTGIRQWRGTGRAVGREAA
jgi:hypothetical protein